MSSQKEYDDKYDGKYDERFIQVSCHVSSELHTLYRIVCKHVSIDKRAFTDTSMRGVVGHVAAVRKGEGINVHNRLLAASKKKTPSSQWEGKGKAAKKGKRGGVEGKPTNNEPEMSFLESLNSY